MAETHQLRGFVTIELHVVQSELLADAFSCICVRHGEAELFYSDLLQDLVS